MLIEQAFIPLPQPCRLLLLPLHNGFEPNIGPIIMQAFLANFYMQLISSSSNPEFCFETGLEKPLGYLQLIFLSYTAHVLEDALHTFQQAFLVLRGECLRITHIRVREGDGQSVKANSY